MVLATALFASSGTIRRHPKSASQMVLFSLPAHTALNNIPAQKRWKYFGKKSRDTIFLNESKVEVVLGFRPVFSFLKMDQGLI